MTTRIESIADIVSSGLCLGCGFCVADEAIKKTIYSNKKNQFVPELKNSVDKESLAFRICPAKGYDIIKESKELFINDTTYSLELGYVNSQMAAYSLDRQILRNASSGGLITQLCCYLLDSKYVDKVVVTRFVYTPKGVRTETIITDNRDELINSQGSKYCPVDMSGIVKELLGTKHKIAFVGTPCQVAALTKLQKEYLHLKHNIVIKITNFCGGFKNYREVRRLAKITGINDNNLSFFRYRGGGQPGSMLFIEKDGRKAQIAYPLFSRKTGYSKMLRCHLCVDATGELADISCGDAWLPEFQTTGNQWSIVICRNVFASRIMKEMIDQKLIQISDISKDQIISSQRTNITSKKYRQTSRMLLYKKLKYSIPVFDGGYSKNTTSMITEVKIFLQHKLKFILEVIGLYNLIYSIIKRKHTI